MIKISEREETSDGEGMAPDTTSFNIVLNALAQGREKNSEFRAEALLERMESLSGSSSKGDGHTGIPLNCAPDEISFNTVLNCWAMSGRKGSAERAIAILDHMKKRHEAGVTDVQPDWSTYTTGKIIRTNHPFHGCTHLFDSATLGILILLISVLSGITNSS